MLARAERATAARHWQAIEAAAGEVPLAVSWCWTETWLRHFGEAVAHDFVVMRDGGRPVAAVLVTRDRVTARRVPLRRLHVGTAGEPSGASVVVERNALLALPDAREAAASTLAQWLARQRDHDELVLDGFLPEDAARLAASDPSLRLDVQASPVADLAAARDAGEDVVATLRAGPRRRVRQSLRAFGELETEWAADERLAAGILDELIALHQERWRADGLPGAFADARFRAFHHELVARLVSRDKAILFRARTAEGTTAGCLLLYVDGRRALFYQSGLGSFAASAQRPGLAVHALCMQQCADRGLDVYDFLAGESRYKRELATGEDTLVWGTAPRRTLRGRALREFRRRRPPAPPSDAA